MHLCVLCGEGLTFDRIAKPATAALLALALLHAQQAPTFTSNVKVVNVLATVRDKQGRIVNDLTQNDFTLQEDGRPQAVKYFSRQTDLPLTLGLLVDTSESMRNVLTEERSASAAFLDDMVREDKDKAFLIHFDFDVELLQDLTNSRAKLRQALDELRPGDMPGLRRRDDPPDPNRNPPNRDPNDQRGGRGPRGHGSGGGTALYDAVFLAADELLKKQPGRKAVVLLTDGEDRGSKLSLASAIEAAQRADTVVYAIYFKDKEEDRRPSYGPPGGGRGGGGGRRGGPGGWPGGGGGGRGGRGGGGGRSPQPEHREHVDGKKILEQLTRETGGRMFEFGKKQSVAEIYGRIQEELRNQYNIGYTSDKPADDGGYRKIALATRRKDQVVQARDGYYPDRPAPESR